MYSFHIMVSLPFLLTPINYHIIAVTSIVAGPLLLIISYCSVRCSGMPEVILRHVCALMVEARYPGLYSDSDMQNMATAMTAGQVQTKRIDKIEIAFDRYLRKVKQNMHIIVSLDFSGLYFIRLSVIFISGALI